MISQLHANEQPLLSLIKYARWQNCRPPTQTHYDDIGRQLEDCEKNVACNLDTIEEKMKRLFDEVIDQLRGDQTYILRDC